MASASLESALRRLRRGAGSGCAGELTDGQLLARFAERQERAALEALVGRHGPLVLSVCRRVLRDYHEAEDAFQTTFLVLVRKARALRGCLGGSLAGWLHTVAHRLAVRASVRAAGRPGALPAEPAAPGHPLAEASGREVCRALVSAVDGLPRKYRDPLVLCYLKGRTHEEAARELAWPLGTVAGRLARARRMLGPRLKSLVVE
jgi:RNA polymerase sigma factor (sigma-70 family)